MLYRLEFKSTKWEVDKMKKFVSICLVLFLSFSNHVLAHDHSKVEASNSAYSDALKETMQIVASLNHYPSDAQKQALTEHIANMDSSVNGVALAETMAVIQRVEHYPSDSDKAKLKKLGAMLEENAGDENLRSLVEIVGNIAHKVSAEDAAKLDAMLSKL